MINKFLTKYFGEKCPNCGKRKLKIGYFTRAYNSLCEQADGSRGKQCGNCLDIIFDEPDFDKWLSEQPDWVISYDYLSKIRRGFAPKCYNAKFDPQYAENKNKSLEIIK